MGWLSLLALAVALAMDAFAVAVAAAITLEKVTRRHLFRLSFHFGLFQAGMVLLGWLVGSAASKFLSRFDHWIVFALLFLVGARMIWGALFGDPEGPMPDRTRGWDLVLLSVATSVDALAVGLSLALLQGSIFIPALVIGIVAAALTAVGMGIGRKIGAIWGSRVEVLGGFILIFIGLKIVFDHVTRA